MIQKQTSSTQKKTWGGKPKPTKYAPLICTLCTVSAVLGIALGLYTQQPLWIIAFLLPATLYEIYRTQGVSTKWASWMMLVILAGLTFLLIFGINWNFAQFLGQDYAYVGGHVVPLGDIQSLGPTLLAVVSLILAIRTAGIYTKWLAGIIFVTSFALVYVLNPEGFTELLRMAVQQIFRQL